MSSLKLDDLKIGIVGLGYVGLPLAVAFAKKFGVIGFDINERRIHELMEGLDSTGEVGKEGLIVANNLSFSSKIEELHVCNFFIVTVPTPVDSANTPDLGPLRSASRLIAKILTAGDFVVYESTVYPGVTEETCIPILESLSGLVLNEILFCGYSPERINPGDKLNKLENIKKVTSGSNRYAASIVNDVYGAIITAGTHLAPSIRVAEAAKVIENTQRDLNIALMNELAIIFDHIGVNTKDVIDAAATKWNFHPYRPGLVGGHCIGVDPYYLTYKSELEGYIPDVILAGRKINDGMSHYVSDRIIKNLNPESNGSDSERCLILGYTFKENCPDVRNTKVLDLAKSLQKSGINIDVFDPHVPSDYLMPSSLNRITSIEPNIYDAIVVAVPHAEFLSWGIERIRSYGLEKCFVFDLKSVFPKDSVDAQL